MRAPGELCYDRSGEIEMETMQAPGRGRQSKLGWELLIAAAVLVALLFLLGNMAALMGLAGESTVSVALCALVCLPMPAIYVGAKRGWTWGLGFCLFGAGAGWLILGQAGLLLFGALLPIILIGSIVIHKKMGAYDSLVLSCGGALLTVALAAGYIYLKTGLDPLTYLFETMKTAMETDANVAAAFYWTFRFVDVQSGVASIDQVLAEMGQVTVQQMREYVTAQPQQEMLRQIIAQTIPTSAVSYILYSGVGGFLIPRYLVKRTGGEVGKMPPFSHFLLPKTSGIYLIITFVLAMLPGLLNLPQLEVAGNVLLQFVYIIFSIQGLALIDYLLRPRIRSTPGRVAILVVIWIVVPALTQDLMLLMWVGLMEQLVRLREKMDAAQQNGGKPNA